MVYLQCLKQNANYWPAGDGILQILCERENYTEAYGWALLWYDKNSHYQRGLDVILDIRDKFNGMGLDFIEKLVIDFRFNLKCLLHECYFILCIAAGVSNLRTRGRNVTQVVVCFHRQSPPMTCALN